MRKFEGDFAWHSRAAGLAAGGLWLLVLWMWLGRHLALNADALFLIDLLDHKILSAPASRWDLPPAPSLYPDLGFLMVFRWSRLSIGHGSDRP